MVDRNIDIVRVVLIWCSRTDHLQMDAGVARDKSCNAVISLLMPRVTPFDSRIALVIVFNSAKLPQFSLSLVAVRN